MALIDLINQLPDTDKEIQAREEAKKLAEAQANAAPGTPPAQAKPAKPDRWGAASKFTGPDPELAAKLFNEALAGGAATIQELISLVREPGEAEYKSYKAEYFLHGLLVHVTHPSRAAQRKAVIDTIISQLKSNRLNAHVQGLLVRELRVCGGAEAMVALAGFLNDENLCADAAAAAVSIGESSSLRAALPKAKGHCRLTLVQSLAALGDQASAATIAPLLAEADADTRIAAAWAVARLGFADAVPALLKAADVPAGWERNRMTSACVLMADNLAAAGKRDAAAKVYSYLRASRRDEKEKYIRDIADKALSTIG